MVELPEAEVLAKQINRTLTGKRIVQATRQNTMPGWLSENLIRHSAFRM